MRHRRSPSTALTGRGLRAGALLAALTTALLGALLLGTALLGADAADAGSAAIALSATEGAPGTIVTVDGRGFPRRGAG